MLSRFSVKRPYTVLVAVAMTLILGFVSFTNMTADLLPSINLPYAIVMTTYVGASPEEVEAAVTKPIEASMATISNIENVSSVSNENYSVVILQFAETTDMDSVTIEMRESLDQMSASFKDGISSPIIMKLNPDMLPIMTAAVDADGLSQAQITRMVADEIVPEFERIEGVASVSTVGDVEETIQVILRQEKIDAINEKIKAQLDEKFAEGQKELDEAKGELENGKTQLNQKKEEAAGQLADGLGQIENGKSQLFKGRLEIEQKLTQLQAAKDKLSEGEKELSSAREQLNTQKSQWEEAKPQMEALALKLSEWEQSGVDLGQIKDQIFAQYPFLKDLIGDVEFSSQGLKNAIDAMDTKLSEGVKQLNASEEELKKSKAQLEEGIAALEEAKAQLDANEISLNDALAALNKNQTLAAIEMSLAGGKLDSAQSQLEEAQNQLDSSKDSAYAGASMEDKLTADTIKQLLTAQNFSMPAGTVTEEGIDYLIRVGNKIQDAEELKELPLLDLHMEGIDPIKLSDVADVVATDNSGEVYAVINGNPAVMLTMEKQTGYSTGEVSNKINARMEELESRKEGLHLTALMDQGIYIDLVMDSVMQNMLFGGLLAILILLVFLRNLRPTFIIACSIPLSVVAAIAMMYFSGITLNIISLSGLALGIGMLVDNSIVVIENIYRMRDEGVPTKKAAVEGAKQVSGAIVASTLTTVCVFLPIVFVEGITRQLFVDMGLTIAYSLLASLIVALTLVPAMSAGLLKKKVEKQSKFFLGIQNVYGRLLEKALHFKALVLIGVVALLVLSAVAAMSRGTAFMPEMESTQASVTMTMEEGTPFEDLTAMADEVASRLETIHDVETVGAMAGGSSMMSSISGSSGGNSISMYLILKEKKELNNQQLEEKILELTSDLNCELEINTSTMDMSALGGSGISVEIKGQDLEKLRQIAKDVAQIVENTKGTKEVSDGMEESTGELKLVVDKKKANQYNLTVAQVYAEVMGRLSLETKATTISTDVKDYDVVILEGDKEETTRENIRNMTMKVTGSDGEEKEVPISEFVTFTDGETMSAINRDSQSRYITVTAEIDKDHNIGLVSEEISKKLKDYEVPDGYSISMVGEDETINEAMGELAKMLALAVAFIYLIMVAQFQSLLSPFIVMFTIPLAFTGGFLGLYLSGSEVSIIAMLGFIMLAGIIVNNGIVLVDYINQLRRGGIEKKEAIIQAGKTRIRPILMTALTTILGLSTMAAGLGMGADMMQPMAIVVIGGLVYGTLLTLFVVPCIYDLLNRKKEMKEEEI